MKKTDIKKYAEDGSIHRLIIEEEKSDYYPCQQCSLQELCNSGSKLLCHTPDGVVFSRSFFIEENVVRHSTSVTIEVDGEKHRLVLMEKKSGCSECSLKQVCFSDDSICLDFVDSAVMPYTRFIKIEK